MPLFNGTIHSLDAHRVHIFAQGRGAANITDEAVQDACRTILSKLRPKGIYQQCFYDPESKSILCDQPFTVKGEDLPMRLERATIILGLALTLGKEVEEVIDQAFVAKDFNHGILLDSSAAIALQSLTEEMTTYLDVIGAKKGYKVQWRWSPGTGDWPANQEKDVVKAVHGETIGLSFTDSGMITPRKTLVAFVGLEFSGDGCSPTACSSCALAGRCHE